MVIVRSSLSKKEAKLQIVRQRSDCELKGEFKAVGLCLSEGLGIFRFVPLFLQPGNHYPAGTLDISRPCFPLQGHGGEWEQTG